MKFAEVILKTEKNFSNRDGEKVRGYFGNKFKDILEFHNHIDKVTFNYNPAFIQYKIIDRKPCIIGINQGADLLIENLEKFDKLVINEEEVSVVPLLQLSFNLLKVEDNFYKYKFETLWFALNSENYKKYKNKELDLNTQLRNNIIEFFKMCDVWADKEIIVKGNFKENIFIQKDVKIKGFFGEFITNVNLPTNISLGKRKSIGFGRIKNLGKVENTD